MSLVAMFPRMPEEVFYRVSAKTFPFTEETRTVIGYYLYERVAERVRALVQENNMQRLSAGIDVFCDRFIGPLADPHGTLYEKDIHSREGLQEWDRVLSLRFQERVIKHTIDFPESEDEVPAKLQKTSRVPKGFITDSFNPEAAGRYFHAGVSQAQKYAQERYGSNELNIKVTFHGTGICASSFGPQPIDPIELQEITLILDSGKDDDFPEYRKIGKVLPEKNHLLVLKTADEIAAEIKILIDQAMSESIKGGRGSLIIRKSLY